jgi:hypothetical protein
MSQPEQALTTNGLKNRRRFGCTIATATPSGVVIRVRNSIPKLDGLGVSRRELKSAAQRGSAVKAAFTLERFCPNNSMAPVLAIV